MKFKNIMNKTYRKSYNAAKSFKNGSKFLKTKQSKHIIISGTFLFLLLFLSVGYETTHLYNNYRAYETLNVVREEIDLTNYDETNYLVKNETLEDMEDDIVTKLNDLHDGYVKTVDDTAIDKELDDVKEDETTDEYEKYNEVKSIVKTDLKTQIKDEKEEAESINIENHDLTSNEEKDYNEIKDDLESVEANDNNIESLYNEYQEVSTLKEDVATLENKIKSREKKEEQEAKEEAERKAQEEAEEAAEEEAAAETLDFSNLTSDLPNEGNFNRSIGDNMFTAINAYRSSLGLTPYTYNSSMQTCVDQEAQAYGTTQNPHNWVCPVANENASNASVGSDAVSISMDFFISDPPHEAVLSGNYSSVAVSAYESGGTDYIIVGVF